MRRQVTQPPPQSELQKRNALSVLIIKFCRRMAMGVGVQLGTERYVEEFGRFVTEECVLIGIFIRVS